MKKKYFIVLPENACLAFADADTVEALKEQLLDLNEQVQAVQATADAEKRELTEDETKEVDAIFAKFELIEQDIARRDKIDAQKARLAASMGPKSTPADPKASVTRKSMMTPAVPRDPAAAGKLGFRSFGEFAQSVQVAAAPGSALDPRLVVNTPSTYSTEGVGADGGFAVPPDFRQAIMTKVMAEDSLLGMTDQMTSSSNTITMPKDETTAWQTSGGVQAYWEGEGNQITQSKIALESEILKLNKLTVLVPVTEELLEDAPALNTYLNRKTPEKMDFKVTDAILNGTGVGTPTGVLNAPCAISVAKEGSQTADTIVFNNIIKMWSRMYGPSRKNAVWLINQDIEPQLYTMSFEGTSSSVPAYMPAGGLSSSPYATLMGRPVIPSNACQTLGDKGDIQLVDLSQYLSATKVGGIRSDVSIHLYFDYDMVAFRFILRVAGQPWWSSAISPKNGSNTVSPFINLAERA